MGLSLAFHTLFTPIAVGMPLLLFVSEGLALRTGEMRYRRLARAWTPVVGLLFAVGAVSGTVLSFELGLLWPRFMDFAGGIIGMPFSLEGFAFFTEAIFLGIYIYGWDRIKPFWHWMVTIPLAVSAAASSVFVIAANAWMNTPTGFRVINGEVTDVNPWRAMFNEAFLHEALHGTMAMYVVAGFCAAAVYAVLLLTGRRNTHNLLGLRVAMVMAAFTIPIQIALGDLAGRRVAELEPVKLATMESQYKTENGAPLRIGGIPINGKVYGAIEIPKGLSYLSYRDPNARVTGLDDFPIKPSQTEEALTHLSFQAMVGSGFLMLFLAIWYWVAEYRKRHTVFQPGKWLLRSTAVGGLLSVVAIETGWFVTEFGRQPWVVNGFVLTSDGATTRDGINVFFILFASLYVVISAGLIAALLKWPRAGAGGDVPREAGVPEPGGRAPDVA